VNVTGRESEGILSEWMKRYKVGGKPACLIISGEPSTGLLSWKLDELTMLDLSRRGQAVQAKLFGQLDDVQQSEQRRGEEQFDWLLSKWYERYPVPVGGGQRLTVEEMWTRIKKDLRWPYAEYELGLVAELTKDGGCCGGSCDGVDKSSRTGECDLSWWKPIMLVEYSMSAVEREVLSRLYLLVETDNKI
jgi:hypothetical protein